MKARCDNPSAERYPRYGGRGIKVCSEWHDDFGAFFRDMGSRPTAKHTIERKNNDGDYCKENCIWATNNEQSMNKSNTAFVEVRGERVLARDVAASLGIPYKTFMARVYAGWKGERLMQPLLK